MEKDTWLQIILRIAKLFCRLVYLQNNVARNDICNRDPYNLQPSAFLIICFWCTSICTQIKILVCCLPA